MSTSPRGMYDMTGWGEPIDCLESDGIRGESEVSPASSLTDPDGIYGPGVVFTEWWANGKPLLRDYRWSDERPCEHYVAVDATAAREDDE